MDWDDLRFFLAIARHGNLTAAARELAVAQSTVGRRLATLEASLGVRLLHRTPDGYILTLAGETVREKARRVEDEALALERTIGGQDAKTEGVVQVTCAESIAAHILAPAFATLQRRHPDVLIELIPDPRELSLSMREADVAVRLTRPIQNDLVIRRVGTIAFALYASAGYLEERGLPDFENGCIGHRFMVLAGDIASVEQVQWLEDMTRLARLGLQTNSHETLIQAAASGAGLACLARFRADTDPRLINVRTPNPPIESDVFVVVHKDNRSLPRIRVVLESISEAMKSLQALLDPAN